MFVFWLFKTKNTPIFSQESAIGNLEAAKSEAIKDGFKLADGNYTVADDSQVKWEGRKPLRSNYYDRGTVEVVSGELIVAGGVIGSGKIVFDMSSLQADTTGVGGGQDRLSGHLKSADFFDVANFPTAVFTITGPGTNGQDEDGYAVVGDLVIKGVSQSIAMFIKARQVGEITRITASLSLDRTRWGIKYGSGSFFDDLADNVIDDWFNVSFDLPIQKA